MGATWATRMRSATLYRVLAVLLVLIAVALGVEPLRRPRPGPPGSHSADRAGASGRRRHWHRGRADGCRRRRAAYPDDRAAVRGRHQDRRQPRPRYFFAHHAGGVRPLQPRPSFEVLRATKGFVLAMATGSIIGTILGVFSLVPSPKVCKSPCWSRSSSCLWSRSGATTDNQLSVPALLAVAARGRLARGEPNRAAGHVRRMIPRAT